MRLWSRISRAVRSIWNSTEFITKWIQVLALAVAAYWAYTRFLSGEKPNLEMRIDLSTALRDERPGPAPDTCYVYFDLVIKNTGVTSFEIKNAHIRAWHAALPQTSAAIAQYINPRDFERGQLVIDNADNDLLHMHFAPGETAGRTFAWVFRTQPPGVYLFKINTEAISGGSRKVISAQTWSQNICNP
jgi:hypothetical protein